MSLCLGQSRYSINIFWIEFLVFSLDIEEAKSGYREQSYPWLFEESMKLQSACNKISYTSQFGKSLSHPEELSSKASALLGSFLVPSSWLLLFQSVTVKYEQRGDNFPGFPFSISHISYRRPSAGGEVMTSALDTFSMFLMDLNMTCGRKGEGMKWSQLFFQFFLLILNLHRLHFTFHFFSPSSFHNLSHF